MFLNILRIPAPPPPGGGGEAGVPNIYDRDDRRNCCKTPLKVTNMGVAPENFTPSQSYIKTDDSKLCI